MITETHWPVKYIIISSDDWMSFTCQALCEFPLWKVLYYINIIIIIIISSIITECTDILVSHNGSWKKLSLIQQDTQPHPLKFLWWFLKLNVSHLSATTTQ